MYYNRDKEPYYDHIIEGAPFNCREFHHSYNDGVWGQGFKDLDFLKKIKKLDLTVSLLDGFQTEFPRLDLLVIYGSNAQNNWYPDYEARNFWDLDGKMQILNKCEELWQSGYRCALVPDYTITDGRTKIEGNKISFNGHTFTHLLFLYPKYAKSDVYEFLNNADESGVPMAVVGRCDIDFDANNAELSAPHWDEYSISVPESIGCPKSAIDGGCIYTDGSFCMVSGGILTGEMKEFSFKIGDTVYSGRHTGLMAYRKVKFAFASVGSELFENGIKVDLEYKEAR